MRDAKFQMRAFGLGAVLFAASALFIASLAVRVELGTWGFGACVLGIFVMTVATALCLAIAARAYAGRALSGISDRIRTLLADANAMSADRDARLSAEMRRFTSHCSAEISLIRELLATNTDLLRGEQLTVQNLLKKFDGTQHVLDKLAALERRIVASVEGGSLTVADELRAATKSSDDTHECSMALGRGLDEIRMVLGRGLDEIQMAQVALESSVNEGYEQTARAVGGLHTAVDDAVLQSDLKCEGLSGRLEASQKTTLHIGSSLEVGTEALIERVGTLDASLRRVGALMDQRFVPVEKSVPALKAVVSDSVFALGSEIDRLKTEVDGLRSESEAFRSEAAPMIDELLSFYSGLKYSTEEARGVLDRNVAPLLDMGNDLESAISECIREVKRGTFGSDGQSTGIISPRVSDMGQVNPAISDFEEFLLEAFGSLESALEVVIQSSDVTNKELRSLYRHVDRAGTETVRQVESLFQLLPRVDSQARRLPQSGGFAMNPDAILLLSDLIERSRPKVILELGSGTSTIWMGIIASSVGAQIISIDHLEQYWSSTSKLVEDFDLAHVVDVRLAPLAEVEIEGVRRKWYDLDCLSGVQKIDMLIVDGPPESTGPDSRYPAFPLLRERLAPGALVVVDDFYREQESRMVEEWIGQYSDLKRTTWTAGRTGVLQYR